MRLGDGLSFRETAEPLLTKVDPTLHSFAYLRLRLWAVIRSNSLNRLNVRTNIFLNRDSVGALNGHPC
jgi:hypothetical protein